MIDNLIAEQRVANSTEIQTERPVMREDSVAGTSSEKKSGQLSAEEKAEQLIKDAEAVKARMYQAPGMNQNISNAIIDEEYLLLTSHLDDNIIGKIQMGSYVDFSKLILKDKLFLEEDHRMQLIVKEGKSYFVPANEHENTSITGVNKWDQAFRVYSHVYARANPLRAAELIQYSHVIHSIAQTFTWDNVYNYDKDFRLHMSKHPKRNWSLIQQQAWSMRLRDTIKSYHFMSPRERNKVRPSQNDICRKFNRGKCNYGL